MFASGIQNGSTLHQVTQTAGSSDFLPNFYPKRQRSGVERLNILVIAANWASRPERATSLPSWKCGSDSRLPLSDLSAGQPVCRGSISDDSCGVRSTAHATYMPHPYAVRSQLSRRKPGTACSLDRGQAANYLISRVNEGVYRINPADRSDHVLLLSWVSKIQGPQNEQHSPLPEHLGT